MFWNRLVPTPSHSANELRDSPAIVELPDAAVLEASVLHIFNSGLGFRKSSERGVCVLGNDQPIPMMSYGLIEYLMGLDLTAFDVLELGGGYSTDFWSRNAHSVVTLETSEEWAQSLRALNLPNAEIRRVGSAAVAETMRSLGRRFDAIVIDINGNRYGCAKAATAMLKPGGFIILDNAEWYPNTTALLRSADLLQVDFHDFRPLRWYRATTSLFLDRRFTPKPRGDRMPAVPIGGKSGSGENDWDRVCE